MPKRRYSTNRFANNKLDVRDIVFGSMLLLVVAVMPLVVRFTEVSAAPELVALLVTERYGDFFSVYKGWMLGIPAAVMAFYAIADALGAGLTRAKLIELVKSPPVAAACVFLFMALVSTIFSSYRHTSWHGTVERGEGMFILLAYFIVFFSAMNFIRAGWHAKVIVYGLAFSSIIMGLLGLSQFVGRDFFMTPFGAWLVMGQWGAPPTQEFSNAYGTLYNTNTLGKYAAMVAPIMLACALAYDGRKWMRLVFLAGGVLMLVGGVMGSSSVGGLVGIAAAVGVTVLTLVCRFFYQLRYKKEELDTGRRNALTWLVSGAVLAALVVGLLFVPTVNQRLDFMLGRVEDAIRREPRVTYDYIFEGDRLTVTRQDDKVFSLVLLEEPYGQYDKLWQIYDASGQPIPVRSRELPPREPGQPRPPYPITYTYDIPGHRRLTMQQQLEGHVIVHNFILFFHEGSIFARAANGAVIDLAVPIPAIGFYGNETWGSNRGHIWSRTLPLMPARTIIGSGPDTYTLVFPQNDVIGKARFHGHPYIPIDKAHNVYMQAWVTTGGISALALIFLFGFYLFSTFVALVRSRMSEGMFIFGLRFGLLAGISAFTVSALATDSTIGSSGVFYLLLGLGYGVNYLVGRVGRVGRSTLPA